jgi:hypothetical protein
VRWVPDVAVSGSITLRAHAGPLRAAVTLTGAGVPDAHLHLRWNTWDPLARAQVTGRVGGHAASLVVPAG